MILEEIKIDDLQINNLKIYQYEKSFKFGTDAVLLSDFAQNVCKNNVLDLCTGTGIVPLLLSAKTKACNIVGVEIQKKIGELAKRSVEYNNLTKRINIIIDDAKKLPLTPHSFDTVTCNPPYMKENAALKNENDEKRISRHEISITFDDCARIAASMLSFHGHFVVVHRPNRLCDVIGAMRKHKIEPKRLRFVHSTQGSAPTLFLIDGTLNGGNELKILPPLYLQDSDGNETAELKKIYNREE